MTVLAQRLVLFVAVLVVVAVAAVRPHRAYAQESIVRPPGADMLETISLPPQARLEGFDVVWQQVNRCSAAALTMLMSYYDAWDGDYSITIRGLNPSFDDVSVRLDEMIRFIEGYGLRAIQRTGGTLDLLKLLVANNIPVLVENTYYDGNDLNRDWMGHNRVVVGYDDALGVVYTMDSLLGSGADGKGRTMDYADFDARWRAFNRDYLIIYTDADLPLLQSLLGDHWDPERNLEWTLAQAETELNGESPDSFAAFNAGTALVGLKRYDEAAALFDRAIGTGLPWRFMWYQFGPYVAYYHTGRYDDMVQMARRVIGDMPGVEESYYYIAFAYAAQGDLERAQANLEVAVGRNNYYSDAQAALDQVRSGLAPTLTERHYLS